MLILMNDYRTVSKTWLGEHNKYVDPEAEKKDRKIRMCANIKNKKIFFFTWKKILVRGGEHIKHGLQDYLAKICFFCYK